MQGVHRRRAGTLGMSGKGVLLAGSVGRGTSNHTGSNRTILAGVLSPPEPPIAKGAVTATTFYGPVLLLALFIGVLGLNEAPSFLVVLTAIATGTFWFWLNIGRPKRDRQTVDRETDVWAKAMARWQRWYYCYRCDGVFVPGTAAIEPASETHKLLYRS